MLRSFHTGRAIRRIQLGVTALALIDNHLT